MSTQIPLDLLASWENITKLERWASALEWDHRFFLAHLPKGDSISKDRRQLLDEQTRKMWQDQEQTIVAASSQDLSFSIEDRRLYNLLKRDLNDSIRPLRQYNDERDQLANECKNAQDEDSLLKCLEVALPKIIDGQSKSGRLFSCVTPFDAYLDNLEMGLSVSYLDPLLDSAKNTLSGLLTEISEKVSVAEEIRQSISCLQQLSFSDEECKKLGTEILKDAYIYDGIITFHSVPLEIQHKRYSSVNYLLGSRDVRVALVVHGKPVLIQLMHLIHETGHALYYARYFSLGSNKDLPAILSTAPFGMTARQESQSQFWQNFVFKNHNCSAWLLEMIRSKASGNTDCLEGLTSTSLFKALNSVSGFEKESATQAEEVHVDLRNILFYETERDLMSGKLRPRGVLKFWMDWSGQYLENALSFDQIKSQLATWLERRPGYHVMYTVGQIFAAQLLEACEADYNLEPNGAYQLIWSQAQSGRFLRVREWLDSHFYHIDRSWSFGELVRESTKTSLSTSAWEKHLRTRLDAAYEL